MRFSATGRGRMDDASFSTAINAAGHGKFQYAALAVAGLTYFTSGMQSGVNAYVLPSIRCSFQLTDSQMGILNAGFLIGGCFSAHLWGALSDSYGRRPVLVGTLLADAICILAASLAPTFSVFAVVRLLSGILNMAPAGLSFLYMGEFFPDVSRTKFSQALGSMWILSWISLSGLAWVVIPQPWSLEVLGLHMESWRFFLLMLLVPTLLAALSASLMPETPKFLQAAGREEEALVVYRRIYSTNTGKPPESYPVKRLHLPVLKKAVAIEEVSAAHPSTHGKGVLHLLGNTIKMSIELFRPPVLYRSLVCCGAYFCSMFVLYSFGYWLPELLNRYDQHSMTYPGVRATVCQVLSSGNSTASAQDDVVGATCADASNVSPAAFSQTLIVNSASASVNLFTTLSTRIIGRRSLAAGCNILSGLVGFGLLYVSSTVEVLSVATLFNALAETGCVAINALIIDIFPPRVSAVGVANVMLSGRLGGSVGNLAMGYLLEHSCQLPLILLFSTVIVCGLLCCFAHRRYEEDEEEGVAADTTPDSTPVQVAVIEVPAVKMTTALSPHAA